LRGIDSRHFPAGTGSDRFFNLSHPRLNLPMRPDVPVLELSRGEMTTE
jgi:hypothetical protein